MTGVSENNQQSSNLKDEGYIGIKFHKRYTQKLSWKKIIIASICSDRLSFIIT
ncbi:hypothetical protein ACK3F5_02510 [Photorhabdus asymbiotica UENP]